MRKCTTATESNRARDAINSYRSNLLKKLQNLKGVLHLFLVTFLTRGRRRGGDRRSRVHSLALAPENGVQFSSQQQQQTRQVHPGEQHDDRGECEVRRVVTIISRHVELKQLRSDDPTDCKENCAR